MREALDLGVNFLDTAENYETEPIVGKAIKGRPRDSVVISTKSLLGSGAGPKSGADMVACLDASLKKLDTDYVDIFHLHGLSPTAYDRAMGEIVPALLREKEKGKFRHLAVSETGPRDPEHKMLERAVNEAPVRGRHAGVSHDEPECAQAGAGAGTRANGIGTLCMFAVRNIFSKPGLLQATIADLIAAGKLPRRYRAEDPLGFLVHPGGAQAPSMRPIASPATSPASTWCCLAPARRSPPHQHRFDPAPSAACGRPGASAWLFGHLVGVGLDLPDRVRAEEARR